MGRPGERNLLLAKGSRIEIYALAPTGLVPLLELPLYGRIVSLVLLPPAAGAAAAAERLVPARELSAKAQQKRQVHSPAAPGAPATEDLLVLTSKLQFAVLRWNPATREVVTIAGGDARDNLGRAMDRPLMSVADPHGRCVGMHLYENLFRIIPRGWTAEAFNVRLGETVRDIAFLHGAAAIPVLAVLYSDGDDAVHLKMLGVKLDDKDFTDAPGGQTNLEQTASTLIAVPPPFFGCLVIGEQTISYFPPSSGEVVSAARAAAAPTAMPAAAAASAAADDEITAVPSGGSRAGGSGSVAALVSIPIAATIIKAVGRMDASGARYLLGDHKGQLSMLILESNAAAPGIVTRLSLEPLGETSIPSALAYLDNGFVFVGSHFGDSQLVRLRTQAADNAYVEVVEHFQNLGPIVDFCVVDLERQGQGQVVTCSGAFKDGSLRVLRNGIGITEQASENLPGIKAMFSLRSSTATEYHSLLLMSFTGETRVLELVDGEEMAEAAPAGLEATAPTLHAGNLSGDLAIQACPSVVALLNVADGFKRVAQWEPPAGARVVAASSAGCQVLVAVTGGQLVSLLVNVQRKELKVAASVTLPNEVSCVDCSLLTGPAGASSSRVDDAMTDVDVTPAAAALESPTLAAVGMWTEVSVRLLSLPSLQPLRTEPLGGQVIARSVLLATLEEVDYLLVALGDGHLFTFRVDATVVPSSALMDDGMQSEVQPQLSAAAKEALLSDCKRVTVGSQPASLSAFTTRGATHVFAACDRPTVVHASAGGSKLLCSHVNLRAVTRVVGFHSAAFPDCLAVATPTSLLLGAVDDIQKLHIRTVPLGEGPRRIAHAPAAHMFGVLTTALAVDEAGDETEDHYLRLLDDTTFETRDSFKLDMNEMGCSLFPTKLPPTSSPMEPSERGLDMAVGEVDGGSAGSAGEECFVLGTAYTLPDEDEPSKGRILVFTMEGGQLRLRAELPVQGAVYCIHHIRGMLVAGVNHTVLLLAWAVRGGVSGTNRALVLRDTCVGSTVALLLATRGDFVIVGDMIKSVSVLRFLSSGDGSERLEEVARDYGCHWMTAVAALDDEVYTGGENGFNMITLRRRSGAVNEDERAQLDLVGTFHTGDFINRLLPGSLVMREDRPAGAGADATSAAALAAQTLLYGAVSGAVGVMVRLSPEDFALLRRVEVALNDVVKGIGGFRHGEWRAFATEAAGPSSGFGTTALGAGGAAASARGYIDGDLIERYLDLDRNKAAVVAEAVDLSVEDLTKRVEELARLH